MPHRAIAAVPGAVPSSVELEDPTVVIGPENPRVDIVVPVYDEQAALARSIRRLHAYLTETFAHRWEIVIADNASVDATPRIAAALSQELPRVRVVRLGEKGRGRALRSTWLSSDADVLVYMDVDLSTDLRALEPLVAPLLSGHSAVAIGTRLAPGSRVRRGARRELISRAYNRILKLALGARFSDAQCGFKAITADAARKLLPGIADEGWFFDTELLMAAQRHGMRIHEVAVDWVDDEDSRVDILATALTDLRGVLRLRFAGTLARFLLVGAASTITYALLFTLLSGVLGEVAGNGVALALTAVANTQANRWWSFRIRDRERFWRQHAAGALVYVIALGLTEGALAVLHDLVKRPSRLLEVAVLIAASLLASACRYVALRTWVFSRALRGPRPGRRRLGILSGR